MTKYLPKPGEGLLGTISPGARKYLDQQASEFAKGFGQSAQEYDTNASETEHLGNTLANAPVLGVAAGGIKMASRAPKVIEAAKGTLPEIKPIVKKLVDPRSEPQVFKPSNLIPSEFVDLMINKIKK